MTEERIQVSDKEKNRGKDTEMRTGNDRGDGAWADKGDTLVLTLEWGYGRSQTVWMKEEKFVV